MDLKPPVPDGSMDIVVAVDPFTRWMEIAPLPTRSSADVTMWFHNQVVCQYGTPMRCNQIMVTSSKGISKHISERGGFNTTCAVFETPEQMG